MENKYDEEMNSNETSEEKEVRENNGDYHEVNETNDEKKEGGSIYSYSYIHPTPGQENPNETTGYQKGPDEQVRTAYQGNPYQSQAQSQNRYQTENGYQSQNRYQTGNQYEGQYKDPYQNNNNQNNNYQNGYQQGTFYNYQQYGNGTSPRHEKRKPRLTGFKKKLVQTIALALVFGLVTSGVFVGVVKVTGTSTGGSTVVTYKTESIESTAESLSSAESVSDVVDSVMPSIVAITTTSETEVQSFFGSQVQETQGAGSGIIMGQDDDYIYIATNNHVVADSIELSVTFVDNETVKAEVKGTDSGSDLAVVQVAIKDIPEATQKEIKVAVLGSSSDLSVGQTVIAIGNALGYGQSVTQGVVSALNRSVTVEDTTNTLIQTDAAINPGNSGGALLNTKGEVIGINSAKYSETSVEGMGFAIPIDDAETILKAIISRESVDESERGYLGIYGQDVTEDIASVYNLPVGVYISDFADNSAAKAAGLNNGDIITKIDEFEVSTMAELQSQLQYYKAGQKVTITAMVNKNGTYKEKTYTVTLNAKSE